MLLYRYTPTLSVGGGVSMRRSFSQSIVAKHGSLISPRGAMLRPLPKAKKLV